MKPHLHPGFMKKIEKMYLVRGSFALVIFNNDGDIKNIHIFRKR